MTFPSTRKLGTWYEIPCSASGTTSRIVRRSCCKVDPFGFLEVRQVLVDLVTDTHSIVMAPPPKFKGPGICDCPAGAVGHCEARRPTNARLDTYYYIGRVMAVTRHGARLRR